MPPLPRPADYLTDDGALPSSHLLASPGPPGPSGSDVQGLPASGAVPTHPAWQRAGSAGPSAGSGSAALLSTPAVAAGLDGGAKRRRVGEDSGTAHSLLPPSGPPHAPGMQPRQQRGPCSGEAAPASAAEAAQLQQQGAEGVASPSDLPGSLADESAGFAGVARLAGSKRWGAVLRCDREAQDGACEQRREQRDGCSSHWCACQRCGLVARCLLTARCALHSALSERHMRCDA